MNQPLPSVHESVNDGPSLHDEASVDDTAEYSTNRATDEIEELINRMGKELVQHIQEHPLASLLVAAGVGFTFASLFKK